MSALARRTAIFFWSTVRQTGADLKRIYRIFVRPAAPDTGAATSSASMGLTRRFLASFLITLLIVGAYRYGQAGAADLRFARSDPASPSSPNVFESSLLTHNRRPPLLDNTPQRSVDLSQQQMSYQAFLGGGSNPGNESSFSNETVDSNSMDSMLGYLMANESAALPSMEQQRQSFLKKIKQLEMLDETDTNTLNREAPSPDPNRELYLDGDIEYLMEQHGVKQFLYFHGEQKRLAFTPIVNKTPVPVPREAYVRTVTKIPPPRSLPTIGNGHIATVVDSADILMNGLYNGKISISHRARIPSMVAFRLSSINPPNDHERTYTMDFGDGFWRETWRGQDYVVQKTTYVHRFYQRIIVCEVDVFRLKSKSVKQETMQINMELKGGSSKDLTFNEGKCTLANCVYIYGKIHDQETPKAPKLEVHIYYNPLFNGIKIPPPTDNAERHKYYFYAAIGPDPKETYNAFKEARQAIEKNNLLSQHVSAWRTLWGHSSITVQGNPPMQNAIVSAMYYIYCSMPLRNDTVAPFTGLSPTDLGHGTSLDDYRGHVFWDQEIWVMPFLLLFKPYLAKLILASRARVVDAAYENAKKNHFRGTQFPWESAYTGGEVGPDVRRNHTMYNHHITGDIALAIQRYAYATKDKTLFRDIRYKKVLNGAATFWDSRLEYDKRKDKYVIKSVMPPDEYVSNVNNSAYTNLIAKIAMQAPYRVFDYLGLPCEAFKSVHDKADQIYQPFDKANLYHPEFENYKIGTKVKQADVILMGYPLNAEMSTVIRRRDLTIYEKVTDKDGPAMTFAMFAVGYAALRDYETAHRMMNRTMKHVNQPFGVWSELREGKGAVNFITGAGGFLQALVNGYGGVRIKEHYLEINPSLPYGVTEFVMSGLKYQGGSFIITIKNTSLSIQQIKITTEAVVPFKVRLSTTKKEKELLPGSRAIFPRVQVALMQVYGIGATIHNEKTEVSPRKPSGRYIIEPPKMKEKKQGPDHKSVWNIQHQFQLPVQGVGSQAGKQRDSGLAPPKHTFGEKKPNAFGGQLPAPLKAKPTTASVTSGDTGQEAMPQVSVMTKVPVEKSSLPKAPVQPAALKPAPKAPAPKPPAPKPPAPKPPAPKPPVTKPIAPKPPAPKPTVAKAPPAAKPMSALDRARSARMKALARFGGRALL